MMNKWTWPSLILMMSLPGAVGHHAIGGETGPVDYAIRDGDTVVFLGDSITAARTYGKIIENYTLLRFPDRRVRFINAGRGGDTAAGGLARLDRDVFGQKATVLIVAYGINDIGWGTKADDEHETRFLHSIRDIVDRCHERKVRVFICSPAITAEDPRTAEVGFLQKMADKGLAVTRDNGGQAIDVQRSMRAIQRKVREVADQTKVEKDRPTLHAFDGVHLNDLGQLAMAYAILKGLNAPVEVSSVTLDAGTASASESQGCKISNLKGNASHLEFDRLDLGLPVNFGTFGALQFRYVPVPDGLNGYTLTVKGLAPGRYEILADNRPLGNWDADQLGRGVNLASATANGWEPGGPWDAQAGALIPLTNARHEADRAGEELSHFLPDYPNLAKFRAEQVEANDRIEALQRTVTRPRPFHFEIRPYVATEATKP